MYRRMFLGLTALVLVAPQSRAASTPVTLEDLLITGGTEFTLHDLSAAQQQEFGIALIERRVEALLNRDFLGPALQALVIRRTEDLVAVMLGATPARRDANTEDGFLISIGRLPSRRATAIDEVRSPDPAGFDALVDSILAQSRVPIVRPDVEPEPEVRPRRGRGRGRRR